MVRVDIEEVAALKGRLREINQLDFEDIEWYENGVKREFPQSDLDDWKYIGMNNTCFVDVHVLETNTIADLIVNDATPG